MIFTINEPRGASTCRSSTLAALADSSPFRGLLLTILGSRSDFHDSRTAGCIYVSVMNTNNFGRFWSVSCTITQLFGDREQFPRLMNPGVRLCVHRQRSQVWPILTRFVDYYSPFRGPEAIFIVVEPQGALTCRSSTLIVLADSGPFRGLSLTVLGSQSDIRGRRTLRCTYMSFINTHSFGRFWPVSWTITHCF